MNTTVAANLPKEMQSHHYPILYAVEEAHWWYVGRRRIIQSLGPLIYLIEYVDKMLKLRRWCVCAITTAKSRLKAYRACAVPVEPRKAVKTKR